MTAPLSEDGQYVVMEGKTYRACYRDADGTLVNVSTGCKTEDMANRFLAGRLADVERIRAGVVTQSEADTAGKAQQSIEDAIAAFKRFKLAQGKTEKHVKETCAIVTAAANACGWKRLCDMDGSDAEGWLLSRVDEDNISHRTCRKTLAGLYAFGGWCAGKSRRYLASNPFQGIEWEGDSSLKHYERRPITSEELQAIIAAARTQPLNAALYSCGNKKNEPNELKESTVDALLWKGRTRALCYELMGVTGLRWTECRTLVLGDVHIQQDMGHIDLQSKNAKMVPRGRIELPTRGFSVRCSTN
jgi:site-specific recombinase XerD